METEDHAWPFPKDCSEMMKMSWRENKTGDSYQTAQETDEERKASLEKMVATNCSSWPWRRTRKKSKTEEDGSYHTA